MSTQDPGREKVKVASKEMAREIGWKRTETVPCRDARERDTYALIGKATEGDLGFLSSVGQRSSDRISHCGHRDVPKNPTLHDLGSRPRPDVRISLRAAVVYHRAKEPQSPGSVDVPSREDPARSWGTEYHIGYREVPSSEDPPRHGANQPPSLELVPMSRPPNELSIRADQSGVTSKEQRGEPRE